MKTILLYGFAGVENLRKVRAYFIMNEEEISINSIRFRASLMMDLHPSIEEVYVVDNTYNLRSDYNEAIKATTIERSYEFYDLIRRNGLRVV